MNRPVTYYKLLSRWDNEPPEALRLFADLVETNKDYSLLPQMPDVPDPWPEDITFTLEGSLAEDIPFQVFGFYLFSDHLKTLIEKAALTGVAFYPVQTQSKAGIRLPRYWYGHLSHVAGTIDMERSTYIDKVVMDKRAFFVFKHVLHPQAIAGWDFFRPAECSSTALCSARFRELFLNNKCSGIGFQTVPVS